MPAPEAAHQACGACGLEKDASCYSKKQFAAKATRRCRDRPAKNADVKEEVAISRAPGPLAKTICWDLYYLLLGAGKDDAPASEKGGLPARDPGPHGARDPAGRL